MNGEAAAMNRKHDSLIHAGICLVMILLSAAGLVYGVLSKMILAPDAPFTIDGILLALICLSTGGIFTLMLAVHAVKEGWIKLPEKKSPAPPASPDTKKDA
jgi:hypothetical protein